MKFTLYIDYLAEVGTWKYKAMEATTLEDAIAEADEVYASEGGNDRIYLIRIMKKVSPVLKVESNVRSEIYKAILCKRSCGWHLNNDENCENEHKVAKTWILRSNTSPWYEAV